MIGNPRYNERNPVELADGVYHLGVPDQVHFFANIPYLVVDDGDTLTFGNGRILTFMMTPYCHFVGAMMTFDKRTGTVFSSDIFGGFSDDNRIYAGDNYIVQMSTFIGEYFGSGRALEYALKRLEKLDAEHGFERLCPQHGCVIGKGQIHTCFKALQKLETGGQVDSLARKHGITLD